MSYTAREAVISWLINAVVILAALAIPFGAFMGFYTDNGYWFSLCICMALFLS